MFNTTLRADAAGQVVQMSAGGALTLGRAVGAGSARRMQSALITADKMVDISAGGTLTINSGSRVLAAADNSDVVIQAGAINLIGSIYGGATVNTNEQVVWQGRSAGVLVTAGRMVMGGQEWTSRGLDVARGGSIQATGLLSLHLTDTARSSGLTVSRDSFLRTDATVVER